MRKLDINKMKVLQCNVYKFRRHQQDQYFKSVENKIVVIIISHMHTICAILY